MFWFKIYIHKSILPEMHCIIMTMHFWFYPLEVVGRGSETQRQVGKICNSKP